MTSVSSLEAKIRRTSPWIRPRSTRSLIGSVRRNPKVAGLAVGLDKIFSCNSRIWTVNGSCFSSQYCPIRKESRVRKCLTRRETISQEQIAPRRHDFGRENSRLTVKYSIRRALSSGLMLKLGLDSATSASSALTTGLGLVEGAGSSVLIPSVESLATAGSALSVDGYCQVSSDLIAL